MMPLIALFLVAANTVTCIRLLIYRRDGARYRPVVSVAAWILIASTGTNALSILLGPYAPQEIPIGALGIALVLCLLSLTARGNVAAILRTDHDEPSDPTARR